MIWPNAVKGLLGELRVLLGSTKSIPIAETATQRCQAPGPVNAVSGHHDGAFAIDNVTTVSVRSLKNLRI